MDDKQLDELLKEKLKGNITPSKEMENRIISNIEQQKKKNTIKSLKKHRHNAFKPLISIAAVVILAFTFGINMEKIDVFEKNKNVTVSVIKTIEPTKLQSGIIENDSEFIIKAKENSSIETIQKSLYVEPALEYKIEETENDNEYKLTFNQNIPDNTILKLQYVKNQIPQNSWAYQTSTKLSVVSTYPSRVDSYVSEKTVIEIEFSYANIENFEENVFISPNIEGNWEHYGKIWRFTPYSPLEDGTYNVLIKNGITSGDEKLDKEYSFAFSVDKTNVAENNCEYSTTSIDNISTFRPNENIRIHYNSFGNMTDILTVELSQFTSINEFIEYLKTGEIKNTAYIGETDFQCYNQDGDFGTKIEWLELTNPLSTGYYIASVKNSQKHELFNCPIQINSLNAYAVETERDVLVWVANKDGLAENVNVEYAGKTLKTDSSGIAKFDEIADGSEEIKYAKIGNSDNKLIVGFYNYKFDNYPSSYLYTDRPVYKNTDTIKVWGFIPMNLFYKEDLTDFYIELNGEGRKKVTVEKDGNFNYEIQLENHMSEDYVSLDLYYKDTIIAFKTIFIENYELQNYSYEIIANKNYADLNEYYDFDVKVKHITGCLVPNKNVLVKVDGISYREVTDESGIAHFSLPIFTSVDDIDDFLHPYSKEIDVYNGDYEEYSEASTYSRVFLVPKTVKPALEKKDKNYTLNLHKLQKDKNTNVTYDLHEIFDGTYDTEVKINLTETTRIRSIISYQYNPYTQENEPVYNWDESENVIDLGTEKTKNGTLEYTLKNIELKEDTEDITYSYKLQFEFYDTNNSRIQVGTYIYLFDDSYENNKYGYYYDSSMTSGESDDEIYNIPSRINSISYYTYRYYLDMGDDYVDFSIGDTRDFVLRESVDEGEEEHTDGGKLLRLVFQEGISKTKIIDKNTFDYTFTEDDFPGCKMTGAYYHNGNFYRLPIYYFDFDKDDRKTDIILKADKESYKPGDDVTISIKTTNNGKPIKSFVNISVVNEAVFALEDDVTDILERIYTSKNYPVYTYSSYLDYLYISTGGGGGGRRT